MALPRDAPDELKALLDPVNLSAPSITKFDVVTAWLAARFGVPPEKAGTYYVSKPGNFDVRFRQPGVIRRKPVVGLAIMPVAAFEDTVMPIERLVGSSPHFGAVIACTHRGDRGGPFQIAGVYARTPAGGDPTLGGLVEAGDVRWIEAVPAQELALDGPGQLPPAEDPYDLDRFLAETGMSAERAKAIVAQLRRKGQIVLQGPPGSGKTWIAERLARLMVGSSAGLVDTVQFHPSYAYEDFVAGVAPKLVEGGLSYDIKPGLFHDFCQMAAGVGGAPCVLVIDEINRADLSRVFGELLMALEYRGRTVRLANGPGDGRFSVPKNVFVIGTMNTADRSIALFDHALRRRFSFVRIDPDYALLRRRLERDGLEAKPLLDLIEDLNAEIRDPNHFVGISFFMGDGKQLPEAMEQIWEGEVLAYVREFFWEQPEVAERYAWDTGRRGALQSWYPAAVADSPASVSADTDTPRGS